MQLGWREYIKRRFQRKSDYASLGIEFGDQALHLSVFKLLQGQLHWVKQDSLPSTNWPHHLKEYVKTHKLEGTPTHLALSVGKYQLLQIDKPKVAEAEIGSALRWSVKDLIPGAKDLVLDYFDLPVQSGGEQKIHLVGIEKSQIEEIVASLVEAKLNLKSIGIEELATCNLLPAQEEAVITLLQEPGEEICLNIVKNQQLYFARRLKGYENLASFSEQELQMGLVDSLSVEIQRSMDYFESQLRQAPVKQILISLDSRHQAVLCDLIKQMTFKPVSVFTPEISKQETLCFDSASFTSLGAALSDYAQAPGAAA